MFLKLSFEISLRNFVISIEENFKVYGEDSEIRRANVFEVTGQSYDLYICFQHTSFAQQFLECLTEFWEFQ